jgi:diaminohydroxyphosphoribosylaminopyrimidine deaminase/5-amino-6-(5-phosphoribosylamino)uracil reductase
MTNPSEDHHHMRAALAIARRGLGATWPNPSVGCVIVKQGRVVGRAGTAPGGRPHAETQALAQAGAAARGATAYVTLEPCSHHGQTPPCADALIQAGIARVVAAGGDPDPRVAGAGLARLRAAGVAVTEGVLAAEAEAMQIGFLTRIRLGRPTITLKLATTLDGRLATAKGESQWITGPEARRAAHALRGRHDAVMVGAGTVQADNPALTCRIPGFRRTPEIRVVLDSHLRTSLLSHLVNTARTTPTWIIHRADADAARKAAMTAAGVRLLPVPAGSLGVDLAAALAALGSAGLTRVLVEGGAQVAGALLRAGLVDRLAWFHAPGVMGGDGWPAAQAFGVGALAGMPRFHRLSTTMLGEDMLSEFEPVAPPGPGV